MGNHIKPPVQLLTFRQHGRLRTTEDISVFLDDVGDLMTDAGYTEKDVFGTRLALEEAFVNAIRHGNRNNPNKWVEFRYTISRKHILLQVQDEGNGFDPARLPNPLAPENLERDCGRGVFLIKSYMTWVEYNEKGNCVTMCKEYLA